MALRSIMSMLSPDREASRAARSTAGRLIYAVGDVHGRFDLLVALLVTIKEDWRVTAPTTRPILVFLGDYIDRGSRARDVLETLVALQDASDIDLVLLRGNHEAAMLAFLDDADQGPAWVSRYGGGATLAAYGIASPAPGDDAPTWDAARNALAAAVPAAHRTLLQDLRTLEVVGDYAFVHAGVRPGVRLDAQSEHDLLSISEPFLSANKPFEKVIVHGHTAVEAPVDGRFRIGVDTGAYATNILTCVRLEGATRVFLQASPNKHPQDGLDSSPQPLLRESNS